MKNFARVIDLGKFDCCAMRDGSIKVIFHFRVRHRKRTLETSITKDYRAKWAVDILFDDDHHDDLKEQALVSLTVVQQQLLSHDEDVANIPDGGILTVAHPQLES